MILVLVKNVLWCWYVVIMTSVMLILCGLPLWLALYWVWS